MSLEAINALLFVLQTLSDEEIGAFIDDILRSTQATNTEQVIRRLRIFQKLIERAKNPPNPPAATAYAFPPKYTP
jgi:hypothetical protein